LIFFVLLPVIVSAQDVLYWRTGISMHGKVHHIDKSHIRFTAYDQPKDSTTLLILKDMLDSIAFADGLLQHLDRKKTITQESLGQKPTRPETSKFALSISDLRYQVIAISYERQFQQGRVGLALSLLYGFRPEQQRRNEIFLLRLSEFDILQTAGGIGVGLHFIIPEIRPAISFYSGFDVDRRVMKSYEKDPGGFKETAIYSGFNLLYGMNLRLWKNLLIGSHLKLGVCNISYNNKDYRFINASSKLYVGIKF
jgi:hypothetical protein